MGRKKRKIASSSEETTATTSAVTSTAIGEGQEVVGTGSVSSNNYFAAAATATSSSLSTIPGLQRLNDERDEEEEDEDEDMMVMAPTTQSSSSSLPLPSTAAPASSSYAVTSHAGELVPEDIYVSDGSEDEDEQALQIVLVGSRLGIMKRGLHHQVALQQMPHRQWTRPGAAAATGEAELGGGAETGGDPANEGLMHGDAPEEGKKQQDQQQQEEEWAKLDPAQRAARLLQEKQRKQEEAAQQARYDESATNAGRDPALFSKRTAFDIRFDQIDEKPWLNRYHAGTTTTPAATPQTDLSDFFNYGLTEEDWLLYSQQQLQIRQELMDAARQKRPLDPNIVPVLPQQPAEALITAATAPASSSPGESNSAMTPHAPSLREEDEEVGPTLMPNKTPDVAEGDGDVTMLAPKSVEGPNQYNSSAVPLDVPVVSGGAWGAGAAPGSMLARLIAEQEQALEASGSGAGYSDGLEPGPGAESTTIDPVGGTRGAVTSTASVRKDEYSLNTTLSNYKASEGATLDYYGGGGGGGNHSVFPVNETDTSPAGLPESSSAYGDPSSSRYGHQPYGRPHRDRQAPSYYSAPGHYQPPPTYPPPEPPPPYPSSSSHRGGRGGRGGRQPYGGGGASRSGRGGTSVEPAAPSSSQQATGGGNGGTDAASNYQNSNHPRKRYRDGGERRR